MEKNIRKIENMKEKKRAVCVLNKFSGLLFIFAYFRVKWKPFFNLKKSIPFFFNLLMCCGFLAASKKNIFGLSKTMIDFT